MEKSVPEDTSKVHDSDLDSKSSTLNGKVNHETSGSDNDDSNENVVAEKENGGVDEHELRRTSTTESQIVYPTGLKLALIIIALAFAVFLVALDNTIIATAIPRITDQFKALDDVGWYGSAYLLTTCAFQLIFGRLYTFYSIKWVYLVAIFIFEIGSAVCGAAPNSTALILGRAIAGLGSAGIFSGSVIIIAYAVPLAKRPICKSTPCFRKSNTDMSRYWCHWSYVRYCFRSWASYGWCIH